MNIPLSIITKTSRQKIRKDTEDLENTIDEFDIIDVYKNTPPKLVGYTFLHANEAFAKIDHTTSLAMTKVSINVRGVKL